MKKLSESIEFVNQYSLEYRHPKLESFEISGLYDLFPEEPTEHKVYGKWPKDTWEYCGDSGVYLLLDKDLNVIYVGKATHFGYRLGQYFMNDEHKRCKIRDSKFQIVRFVVTIKVPSSSSFEASALEEYLIQSTLPPANILGK